MTVRLTIVTPQTPCRAHGQPEGTAGRLTEGRWLWYGLVCVPVYTKRVRPCLTKMSAVKDAVTCDGRPSGRRHTRVTPGMEG